MKEKFSSLTDEQRELNYELCEAISPIQVSVVLKKMQKAGLLTADEAKDYKNMTLSLLNLLLRKINPTAPRLQSRR